MDDASLDEFLTGSSEESEGVEESTDTDGTVADDSAESPVENTDPPNLDGEEIDPATATSRWDPEGAACGDCDTTVERRWRDDGWVCRECKEW